MNTGTVTSVLEPHGLQRKMSAIVDYLAARQAADGSFPTLRRFLTDVPGYVRPTEFDGWYDFGACPFATANIAYHLKDVSLPGVAEIRRRACASLQRGLENGVARYVPAHAKPIDFPADVDDTCLAAVALHASGIESGYNLDMVLDNRDGRGNIFTWLIPRWRHLRRPRNLYWLIRDRRTWRTQMQSYGHPPERLEHMEREYRFSLEPGIAANVLLCTGVEGRHQRRLLETLIARVERDDVPLGYYASIIAAYFHVARLYPAGATAVGRVRQQIINYLVSRQTVEGEVEGPLNTAFAALTMMYFDCWDDALSASVNWIFRHPMHDDGWLPVHYCNDLDDVFVDGGAELTAAFFLEVLFRQAARTAESR